MSSAAFPLRGSEGPSVERRNPATGAVVSRERARSVEGCLQLASAAAAAFPSWSATVVSLRQAALRKWADTIREAAPDLIRAMMEETGATRDWAAYNAAFAAEMVRGVAAAGDDFRQVEILPRAMRPGVLARVERVPAGVVFGIAPWNAPLILGVRALAAPLLVGNTVLVKGNEFAPRTFRLLGETLTAAGLPRDVAAIFLVPPEDSEACVAALIGSPVVRRVSFTGSTRVGRHVAELCARHLKRPLLELGGQAPVLVLADADLDLAAEAAVKGAFLNQGQICMSTERLIVAEGVADALIDRIDALRRRLRLGNPLEGPCDLGPVISAAAAERIAGLLADATGRGARLVGGGGIRHAFVEPTLIDGIEPGMRLYHEEAFGPVLSVTRVASDGEAITVANDSDYGLAAAVFSQDTARADRVARAIQSGICHINRATVDDNPHAPFGGVKASGYGRFGGAWAFDEFAETRWITARSADADDRRHTGRNE